MFEEILSKIGKYVLSFVQQYYVLYLLGSSALFLFLYRKPIDALIMKKDTTWQKWYRGKFLCPSCLKRMRPYDYPPNYYCSKCGNAFAFGDQDVREWPKKKPIMTKGEFIRRLVLLGILAIAAFYVFNSGMIAQLPI
jgi:hypothetical protein